MTALGNFPCNGFRACCLHDMTRPMPERGDLIWIFEHEIMATAAGPAAILQCFLSKCFLSNTRPEQSSAKVRLRAAVVARAARAFWLLTAADSFRKLRTQEVYYHSRPQRSRDSARSTMAFGS
jgi:hypothetical protein